jgi:hypothetical protein
MEKTAGASRKACQLEKWLKVTFSQTLIGETVNTKTMKNIQVNQDFLVKQQRGKDEYLKTSAFAKFIFSSQQGCTTHLQSSTLQVYKYSVAKPITKQTNH